MSRIIIVSLVTLFLGLVVGLNLTTVPSDEFENSVSFPSTIQHSAISDSQYNELQERVVALENILHDEINKHESLGSELAALKKQMLLRPAILPTLPKLEGPREFRFEALPRVEPIQQAPRSTAEILSSLGVDESVSESIKTRAETRELEQLFLRNRATREGWYGTEKYFEEARKLETSANLYRDELGDDKYDQYLFESGLFNRVSVMSVLSGSPAAEASIEAGDIIYRYDNTRLFSWMELTELTSQGVAGEPVPVEVHRGDQVIEVYIPRGPLGVRLSGKKTDSR